MKIDPNQILESINELPQKLKDSILFSSFMLLGSYFKMQKQKRKEPNKEYGFSWYITEFLMSLFVGLLALTLLDHFIKLPKLLTYMVCSLFGSMSTLIHDKIEDIIRTSFEAIQQRIKNYFAKKE